MPRDVAKMLQSPIFHVNGEHPESVAQVVDLAMDFREKFRRDVVIDMYCYRRWGHNEADEPGFTQPLLYQAIEHQRSVRDGYLDHLLKLEGVTREEADRIAAQRFEKLEHAFEEARRGDFKPAPQTLTGIWRELSGGRRAAPTMTPRRACLTQRLSELLTRLAHIPEGFHLHKTLQRGIEQRLAMAGGKRPLDWAAGEALALATLATEGHRVRLSGQDSQRGHVQPAARRFARRRRRARFLPICFSREGSGPRRDHQQPTLRNGRAGIRLRLQPRRARRLGGVGGSIRRFCQRRAGDHRPVYRRGRRSLAAG